ncbi:MAG: glycosyl hydrolase family 28-related protein [Armatimonadota bacterium]
MNLHVKAMIMSSILIIAMSAAVSGASKQKVTPSAVITVRDFGAKGDGKTDDTKAFQSALNEAGKTGNNVFVPAGNYVIKGNISIPPHTTMEGVFKAPTARAKSVGSILWAYADKGNENGTPFIFMNVESCIKGLNIFYPEQDKDKITPYPWTIRGMGDNISIVDVNILNPWKAVDFGTHPCGRHYVKGLYGQPLNTGIIIDNCLDVGRLQDIHFWPFWSDDPKVMAYTSKNATAFIFGRTDWEFVVNAFCISYNIGFRFTSFGHDASNVMFLNCGPDAGGEAAVLVEATQVHAGLLFTNCQINGRVIIKPEAIGPVRFDNCNMYNYYPYEFWIGAEKTIPFDEGYYIHHEGSNRLTLSNCHLYFPEPPFLTEGYPYSDTKKSAIYSNGAGLTISGSDFTAIPNTQVKLGPKSKSTIIYGNAVKKGLTVVNEGSGKPEVFGNIQE